MSVLLVLKLAILLRDTVSSVMLLLRDAHSVLQEVKKSHGGIEKCEAALQEYASQTSRSDPETVPVTDGATEVEFQEYVPSSVFFEWEFPGLKLKYTPFGWQHLFVNIDGLF